jgi:Nuclease-related domain
LTTGRSGLINRLREWAEIQKMAPTLEAPDVTGGRDAEHVLKQLIGSSFAFADSHVFAGRRIPSKRQGRRREIDLIVCTPSMIHLIEVKNWSGSLTVHNRRWSQSRRSGDVVDHGDLLETNLLKQDAVAEYLRDQGITIDDKFSRDHMITQIIFMNPRLELDPATEALPEIITRRELDHFLGREPQRGRAEWLFSSLIELCRASESKRTDRLARPGLGPIPGPKYKQITTCLSETETWDQLHLYGTKVITGDVVRLQLGAASYRKQELVAMMGTEPIRLWWTRNWLWGLLKVVTGLGTLGKVYLGKNRTNVTCADTVTFHAVGDENPKSRGLAEVDRIVLG